MSHQPRGLGRGLGALFPGNRERSQERLGRRAHRHSDRAGRHRAQRAPAAARLPCKRASESLAQSIKANGVLAPIVLRAPQTRRAAQYEDSSRANAVGAPPSSPVCARIPGARARRAKDGQASIELALLENLQRADLNPIEEAAGYRQLIDEHGLTQENLSERLGKGRPTIANALRLLSLPDHAGDAARRVQRGPRTRARGVAESTRRKPCQARRIAWLERTRDRAAGVARRAAAVEIESVSAQGFRRRGRRPSPDMAEVENRLRFALATRVTLVAARAAARSPSTSLTVMANPAHRRWSAPRNNRRLEVWLSAFAGCRTCPRSRRRGFAGEPT